MCGFVLVVKLMLLWMLLYGNLLIFMCMGVCLGFDVLLLMLIVMFV